MAGRQPERLLSETEWAVRHAALDLSRRGIFPTIDRLYECESLADFGESAIRAAAHELVRLGKFPRPAVPAADLADAGLPVRASNRTINVALYRIVEDKGSLYESLSLVTGLSIDSIKCRVHTARECYPTEELDPYATRLSLSESSQVSRSIDRYVLASGDAAVREFAASTFAPRRVRPDSRSLTRDKRSVS